MTILTEVRSVLLQGNGVATRFPFAFRVFDEAHVVVTRTAVDGTEAVLSPSQYSVEISASGGTVTYPLAGDPLIVGESLLIERVVPLVQQTDLTNQGPFFAEAHENVFDYLTMITQQHASLLDRTIRVPRDEAPIVLPPISQRAGKLFSFDATGQAEAIIPAGSLSALAGISSDLLALAAISDDIMVVADNDLDISTLAGIASAITLLAEGNIALTDFSAIINKPTTLAGYGITDGGIGTDAEVSSQKLRATSIHDVSLTSTAHGFQVGASDAPNIAMDGNEIMSRNNGATNTLHINLDGGAVTVNGGLIWHTSNDGAGSGLDADLLDGLHASDFIQISGSQILGVLGDGVKTFQSNSTMQTAVGNQSTLEVFADSPGNDAFMTFHVGGDYAAYFGLDGGFNDLAFGGWSRGAVSHRVWHAGNDGAGSTLDADTVDGLHAFDLFQVGQIEFSDIRLKENVEAMTNGLLTVMNMKPVWFDWKSSAPEGYEGRDFGFIAQWEKDHIPELVTEHPHNDMLAVHYPKITALLVSAVQTLTKRVEQLEAQIKGG